MYASIKVLDLGKKLKEMYLEAEPVNAVLEMLYWHSFGSEHRRVADVGMLNTDFNSADLLEGCQS
jgi:hypothetical protein